MTEMLKGNFYSHFETGMEDANRWAFYDGAYAELDEYGRQKRNYEGLHFLEDGDYIEVLDGTYYNPEFHRDKVEYGFHFKGEIEIVTRMVHNPLLRIEVRSYCPAFAVDKEFPTYRWNRDNGRLPRPAAHDRETGRWAETIDEAVEMFADSSASFSDNKERNQEVVEIFKKNLSMAPGWMMFEEIFESGRYYGHLRKA